MTLVKRIEAKQTQSVLKDIELKLISLLQMRNNLSEDDTAYLITKASSIKDERLKRCIVELMGWGDDERSELETIFAILLEVAKMSKPSLIKRAVTNVEIKAHIHEATKNEQGLSPLNCSELAEQEQNPQPATTQNEEQE